MNPNQFDNRRHKSVFNFTNMSNLNSPYTSHNTTINSSFNSYTNTNNNMSYPKTGLQTNSLFAYQEYDHFSTFLENTQMPNSVFASNSRNNQNENSSISKDTISESDYLSEEKDFQPILKQNKRLSAIMTTPLYQNGFFIGNDEHNFNNNIANGNGPGKIQKSYNNYQNCSSQSPVKIRKPNLQVIQKNSNEHRRFSHAFPIPFNLGHNLTPNQMHNSINTFIGNQNIFCPGFAQGSNYPMTLQNNNPQNKESDDNHILDNLNTLLIDQLGCREVQKHLEEKKKDKDFMKLFYDQVEDFLVDAINHNFGNYVIQKFIEILIYQKNSQLLSVFFSKIKNDLFNISINIFGTRFFQKSLEKLDDGNYSLVETPLLNETIRKLIENYLFLLCKDTNGNHVFQKIMKVYPKDKNEFIFTELNKYAIDISKIKEGVIIFQTVIKCSTPVQKNVLIKRILSEINSLINDRYGNYMIHYIFQLQDKEFNEIIYTYLTKNISTLSKKKFSSNVLDKCLIPDNNNSLELIKQIIVNKLVKELIVDQYGNYVIQKALNITIGYPIMHFMAIIHQIEPVLDSLKGTNLGKKIYDNLIETYGEYFRNSSQSQVSNPNQQNESQMPSKITILKDNESI